LLISFSNVYVYASDISFWAGTGIGAFTFPHLNGYAQGYGDFNLRYNNLIFQGRVVSIMDKSVTSYERTDQVVDGGLLFGFLNDFNPYLRMSFSGGLSYIYCVKSEIIHNSFISHGTEVTNARSWDTYRTIGIPIDVQLLIMFTKYLGVGISALANVNEHASYAGCALTIKFGVLK